MLCNFVLTPLLPASFTKTFFPNTKYRARKREATEVESWGKEREVQFVEGPVLLCVCGGEAKRVQRFSSAWGYMLRLDLLEQLGSAAKDDSHYQTPR